MKSLFNAFIVVPLFAMACGAGSNADNISEASARQALGGEGGDTATVETTVESVDEITSPAPQALVAGDAGAAEAPARETAPTAAPVGDAGGPVVDAPVVVEAPGATPGDAPVSEMPAPAVEEPAPAPVCPDGEVRCTGMNAETCWGGVWTVTEACDLICFNGSCGDCIDPGTVVCEENAIVACTTDYKIRRFEGRRCYNSE